MRALVLLCALGIAQAQTSMDTQAPSVSAPPSASAPVPKPDIKEAASKIRRAWGSRTLCWDAVRCATYFSSFGTAITFNDGTMVPLAHEQRLGLSGHECIQRARAVLHEGNRALAVQWVMAAYLDNPLVRNWLADHPDAVVEGLRRFGD